MTGKLFIAGDVHSGTSWIRELVISNLVQENQLTDYDKSPRRAMCMTEDMCFQPKPQQRKLGFPNHKHDCIDPRRLDKDTVYIYVIRKWEHWIPRLFAQPYFYSTLYPFIPNRIDDEWLQVIYASYVKKIKTNLETFSDYNYIAYELTSLQQTQGQHLIQTLSQQFDFAIEDQFNAITQHTKQGKEWYEKTKHMKFDTDFSQFNTHEPYKQLMDDLTQQPIIHKL